MSTVFISKNFGMFTQHRYVLVYSVLVYSNFPSIFLTIPFNPFCQLLYWTSDVEKFPGSFYGSLLFLHFLPNQYYGFKCPLQADDQFYISNFFTGLQIPLTKYLFFNLYLDSVAHTGRYLPKRILILFGVAMCTAKNYHFRLPCSYGQSLESHSKSYGDFLEIFNLDIDTHPFSFCFLLIPA